MFKIGIKRKLKSGKTIRYKVRDRGKKGKTPKTKQWYHPEVSDTGWSKDLPAVKRRRLALKAHGNDLLSTARSLQALANVTTDRETERLAKADAEWFYARYRNKK